MSDNGGISFDDAAGPDGMRIYAIGDVHGRFDCLTRLHGMIRAEIERDAPRDWRIIHLGDYVDRGPQSNEVLNFLSHACATDSRMLALMGNHDEGFVRFLDDPQDAYLFIEYGGYDTCASYLVYLDARSRETREASRRKMLDAMPASHVDFLRELPQSFSYGDFFFCHAGIRPGVVLDQQDPHDLMWIRREFLDHESLLEKVVVHGHTPSREPVVKPNRVNVDTKAFESGRLTALVIDGREKLFLATAL